MVAKADRGAKVAVEDTEVQELLQAVPVVKAETEPQVVPEV